MNMQYLRILLDCKDAKTFADVLTQREVFVTRLSDGTERELCPGGARRVVTFENRHEFVKLVYEARLNEFSAQVRAIRSGIGEIIPLHLLALIHWKELEILICGKQSISWDLLRRHTKYAEHLNANLPHIKFFWETLEEFTQEERRKFIRFAWAQERLPTNDDEFVRTHTRLMINPAPAGKSQDNMLPKAHTCFFNLELPAYTTKEKLRERLVYAITETVTMNLDERTGRRRI